MNILLTRALSQVKPLQNLVKKHGYQPLLFPSLVSKPLDNMPLKSHYDALIFISTNAVEYGIKTFKMMDYQYSKIFAVGATTAKKLNQYNIKVDAFPREKASSEALLAMPEIQALKNQSILIFRGEGGREILKQGLENNNTVEYIEIYQRVVCDVTSLHQTSLVQFLQNDKGVVTATSVENLCALISIVEKINIEFLTLIKRYPLVVLSERIKTFAQSVGFNCIKVADKTNDMGLLKSIQCVY